ncbi:hypothetical protein CYLTODRAFT_235373 [Cylindrobasidium torrendii FP15055 ss-10]|uniref:Uncharacterized protein n=1 Tax=Cylindrobasidium torrendii FP15055 ss-10 TaxID=1314674 RepID=A0A0D7BGA4_9AGAR|nr:hypothetical protein CYLTODRAFT_235373 [Cylindrobasidium torrendii FP15055 ss-10]
MARFKVTRLAFYLLRISPELYQGVKPGSSPSSTVPSEIRWAILRAVVETLASETVAVEHAELLAEFLATEQGRCSLFKKVVFKRLEDGEFEVPSAVLEDERESLLKGVLTAVDGIILAKGEANPEVLQYVGLCKRLFSRMRGIVNVCCPGSVVTFLLTSVDSYSTMPETRQAGTSTRRYANLLFAACRIWRTFLNARRCLIGRRGCHDCFVYFESCCQCCLYLL